MKPPKLDTSHTYFVVAEVQGGVDGLERLEVHVHFALLAWCTNASANEYIALFELRQVLGKGIGRWNRSMPPTLAQPRI